MLEYIKSKWVEYTGLCRWIDREIQSFKVSHPHMIKLLERLDKFSGETNILLDRIQAIIEIGDARLFPRAFPCIHEIEFIVSIVTDFYLPALQKELVADRKLRNLLMRTIERLNLTWIEDLAVRLDGPHATIAIITEAPLIVLPPQQSFSFLNMAGLYHEFGHNVFHRFPEIGEALNTEANRYYADLKQQSGLLSPQKVIERIREIDTAVEYWNSQRLAELFSDIFGTFVCGSAHYYACVDLALRYDEDPWLIDETDVHPPPAARVYACFSALSSESQNYEVTSIARAAWDSRTRTLYKNAVYGVTCADGLIQKLTSCALHHIEHLPINISRYSEPLLQKKQTVSLTSDTTLEDAINLGMHILLEMPDQYLEWEKNNVIKLLNSDKTP